MRKLTRSLLSLILSACILLSMGSSLILFPASANELTEAPPTANNIETAQNNGIDFYVYVGDTDLAFYCPKPSEEYPEFWYSDDESVATISSSGVVTPLSEGTALITAEVQYPDGWLYNVCQITLHVLELENGDLGNGVFDISGPSITQILSSYETGEALTAFDGAMGDSNVNPRSIQYKINYVGNGAYTIRSMLNNSLAWTYSGGSLVLTDIGSLNSVPDNAKWNIVKSGSGYKISPFSSPYLYVTCPTSFNSPITLSSSNSSNQIWSFSELTLTDSGVDITSDIMYTYAGDTVNMEAAIYSYNPYFNGGYDFYWSVDDPSVATINQTTGQLTGISEGSVEVTVDVETLSANISWTSSYYLFVVFVPENGTYYIQNVKTNYFIEQKSLVSGEYVLYGKPDSVNKAKWIVERVPNSGGYVRIKSYYSNYYMGIDSSNPSLVKQYSTTNDYTLWKIEYISAQKIKITCKATESSNKVLAVPTSPNEAEPYLTNILYTNNLTFNDEWYMFESGSDVYLLGVLDNVEEYDHKLALMKAMPVIQDIGYDGFNLLFTTLTNKTYVKSNMENSKMFISISHGGKTETETFISLSNSISTIRLSSSDIYDFDTNTPLINLTNCDLMIFIGCYTGDHDTRSLPHAAVAAGASCAIGFKHEIDCYQVNLWLEMFLRRYSEGYSIESAAAMASLTAGLNDFLIV